MFYEQPKHRAPQASIEQLDGGVVLLPGNEESPMNYPTTPTASGRTAPSCTSSASTPRLAGVIDVDEGTRRSCSASELDDRRRHLGGPAASARASGARRSGVDRDRAPSLRAPTSPRRRATCMTGRPVAMCPSSAELLWLQELLAAAIREGHSVPLIQAVVEQRSSQDRGGDRGDRDRNRYQLRHAHPAMHLVRPGMVEREVAGAVEGVVLSRGGLTSFPIIFSVRGEVLHNHGYANVMKDGQRRCTTPEPPRRWATHRTSRGPCR